MSKKSPPMIEPGEFGVMVEDNIMREYIKDDNGLLTGVHDTGVFQITPLETHISGFSPRNGMSDEDWHNRSEGTHPSTFAHAGDE